MGSLYNLYISQSYQSLVHFGSDWTASANLIQLEDGYGNGLGVSMNTDGDITAVGDITASNLYAPTISGSNGHFSNNLFVSGTLQAYELKVVIESSSIIFTSGSNIIGDNANQDTQTLVGRIINTGSLEVTGSTEITNNLRVGGNATITGSVVINGLVTTPNLATTASNNFIGQEKVTGSVDIKGGLTLNGSSSFTELTGSLSAFSQSIDARIISAQGILQLQSQSVILGLARTLDFSGADVSISIANQTGSVFVRTTQYATTASLQIVSASAWGAFQSASAYSASAYTTIQSLSSSIYQTDATQSNNYTTNSSSVASRLNTIEVRYATTGSNTFVGNQILTGSLTISSSADLDLSVIGKSTFSGSVRGNVTTLAIASQTASIDCSLGNFFDLTLVSSSNTYLTATNIQPGQTLSVRIAQPSVGYGTLTYSSLLKFSQYTPYNVTPGASAVDILSAQSYDTASLYFVAVQKLV